MKRFLSILASLALYGMSSDAYAALSCKEIVELNSYNTKSEIIIKMMKSNPVGFGAADVACLKKNSMPADIIEAAQEIANQNSGPEPEMEAGPSELDSLEDDNDGSRMFEEENRPEKIMIARNNIKSNKPASASYLFYEMLKNNEYPEYKTELNFYMGKSLEKLKLYQSAYDYYTKVVKAGPKSQYFNLALPRLVRLSQITGDERILKRVAEVLPPQNFPRKAKNNLFYLLGVKNYEDKKIRDARSNFNKVTSRSLLALKAEFYLGVIAVKTNPLQASKAFRSVYEERVEPQDEREAAQINKIKELALLNNASIYYSGKKFSDASKLYQAMDRGSIYWPESLFRDAWANFMLNNLDITLGKILTVESPYFKENQFIPETEILKALTYLRFCDFNRVEDIVLTFRGSYEPVHQELKKILEEYQAKEARSSADRLWDFYFDGEEVRETQLPKALFNRVLNNQDLSNAAYNIKLMREEFERINLQKPQWKDTVGVDLQKELENSILKNKKLAGVLLLKAFKQQDDLILNLLNQTEFIEIDVKDKKGQKLIELANNVSAIDFNQKFNVDFATSADVIYWPFNKEFWSDELGYYSILPDNACSAQ
jgi:TolA-binding protein